MTPAETIGFTAADFPVDVLLFAVHAERLGRSELRVQLPVRSTVASLRDALARAGHGELLLGQARVAVNQRLAHDDEPIHPGDEVALIPPVAGG